MTEEELEKKAKEYADKNKGNYFYSLATIKEIKQFYKDGYEQGQEEREEQIQTDISWIDKLEKENEELKREISSLRTTGQDEYINALEEQYEELKKENEELKQSKNALIIQYEQDISELKEQIEKIKQWVKDNTQADGCIDCSVYETDELLEILNS